jgi:hypothetical protein
MACQEATEACLEKAKVNPEKMKARLEEMEAIAVHQKVPYGEAKVETVRAQEDRYGDWHLAVGRHRQQKKWTQGYGGSRKKLAATHQQMTWHGMRATVIQEQRSRRDNRGS